MLFGTFGTNDNEEAKKILDYAYSLKGDSSAEKLKRRYDALQEGLKKYPNNVLLLVNSLETGNAIAYPENNDCYDEVCGNEIYQECIRQANVLLSVPKNVNINDILRAHMIMVTLHSAYGNIEKSRELAEKFPVRSDMTFHLMSAFIAHHEKNYADEAKHSRENTKFHLESLAYAMMQLANAYKHMQRNDYALDVYNRVKQLLELFPNDEHFSTPTVWAEWGQLDELITKLQS